MAKTHNLGFPRVGARRELKSALESYWAGRSSRDDLLAVGAALRQRHWRAQAGLDFVPVGDFSFYDQVLDASFLLDNLPERVRGFHGHSLDNYFRVARGRSAEPSDGHVGCCGGVAAGDMTKWFDTNYHYIVPELSAETHFQLDASRLIAEVHEAKLLGAPSKPVLIGPLTYLALGKTRDGSGALELLPRLLPLYRQLLELLASEGVDWVQMDEPLLVTELDESWKNAYERAYRALSAARPRILLASYFGELADNLALACALPVHGLHLDAVNARHEVGGALASLGSERVLSLGVIDGRNIWKTDLSGVLDWLEPVATKLGERLWLAPSCSLLHVPYDASSEQGLDAELRGWLAFAVQKLDELRVLAEALNQGREAVRAPLAENRALIRARRTSPRVHSALVQAELADFRAELGRRASPSRVRAKKQQQRLKLPSFPTTTIGSFPQTVEIRALRRKRKRGEIDEAAYDAAIRREIARAVEAQERLGLDVLVHGEAERSDMVEYFGEQLGGFAFTESGWVQSYGSRCVKPPILYGDVARPEPMTLRWIRYAQSLTHKPVKGMLTGPVTLLNWSFVRDDQPRARSCLQLALAVRKEVLDLERAGVAIIQVDEAALREGLPLRKAKWSHYLGWAVEAFRVAVSGVRDETQIHTHMCYSEFNDILPSIADLDADVITIETSRSDLALLRAFEGFEYPSQIGPGVYDIHSPNVPSEAQIVALLRAAARCIPAHRLWVNPDCGLKTRRWTEVLPALTNMVSAAKILREADEP